MSTELRDWQAAMSLAAAWRHGQCPGEVDSAVIQCTVLRYGGVRLAFAGSDPSTHPAAAQWHVQDLGTAVLTAARVLVLGRAGPVSFGLAAVRRTWREPDGTALDYGQGTYKLVTPWPVWFDVALNVVGYHRLPPLRPPAHLARRLGRVDP